MYKGPCWALKRTNGEFGQDPQTAEMPTNTNKTSIGLVTGIGIKLDQNWLPNGEKNAKRTNGSIFTKYWGSRKQNNAGNVRLPKHMNAGHLFAVHEAQNARFLGRVLRAQNAGNSEDLYLHEVQKRLGSWGLLSLRGTRKLEFGVHEAQQCLNVKAWKHKNIGHLRMSGLMKVPKAQKAQLDCSHARWRSQK